MVGDVSVRPSKITGRVGSVGTQGWRCSVLMLVTITRGTEHCPHGHRGRGLAPTLSWPWRRTPGAGPTLSQLSSLSPPAKAQHGSWRGHGALPGAD